MSTSEWFRFVNKPNLKPSSSVEVESQLASDDVRNEDTSAEDVSEEVS